MVDVQTADCCDGYWNETTEVCWTTSDQNTSGSLSDSQFCSTLDGLDVMGGDLGAFLENIAPGIGTFIIYLVVFGGIAALIYAIVHLIKKKVAEPQRV